MDEVKLSERNKLKDRERIKQYIESTMREFMDEISDAPFEIIRELYDVGMGRVEQLSRIYKNMGFDKE